MTAVKLVNCNYTALTRGKIIQTNSKKVFSVTHSATGASRGVNSSTDTQPEQTI
jgi:hypothetical protein